MKRIGKYLLVAFLSFNSVNAMADPGEDALLQEILDLQTAQLPNLANLANLPQQLQELIQQNLKLANIQSYLYGDTGLQNYLNGTTDMNQRLWANDSWQDVLNAAGGGNSQAFAQMQQSYAQKYPVVNKEQIGKTLTDNDLIRAYYEQNQQISRAALASSAYSYNTINQHMKNVQDILSQIKNTPTEKASMDMNARLLAEVSYIQLETLRQQNFQTQIMATQSQGEVNGLSDQSKFEQLN
jgi:hypothetical protein